MGFISRLFNIIKANINALFDKAEEPEKMINQSLLELTANLNEVKRETAGVLAEEERCRRALTTAEEDVSKWQSLAEKAVIKGNDEDARAFLVKKNMAVTKLNDAKTTYELAHTNADKMRAMHDELSTKIDNLTARKESILAKYAVAKTQEKINNLTSGVSDDGSAAFIKMENKVDKMLDTANAMADLNDTSDDVTKLADKYETPNVAVDDELAALKLKHSN